MFRWRRSTRWSCWAARRLPCRRWMHACGGAYASRALSRGGTVRFLVSGGTGGNVHLRKAHFEAVMDESRSLELSRAVVAAKLQNSRRVVGRWSRDEKDAAGSKRLADRSEHIRQRIARLADAATGDHIRGIEGDAAPDSLPGSGAGRGERRTAVLLQNAAAAARPRQRDAELLLRAAGYGMHRRSGERGPRLPDGVLPSAAGGPAFPCARPGGRTARADGPVRGVVGAPPADWDPQASTVCRAAPST